MKKLKRVRDSLKKELKDPHFRQTYELEEMKARIALIVIESRIEKNLTQQELAKMIGVKQQEISRIENGEIGTFRMLYKVLRALGRSVKISFPKKYLRAA